MGNPREAAEKLERSYYWHVVLSLSLSLNTVEEQAQRTFTFPPLKREQNRHCLAGVLSHSKDGVEVLRLKAVALYKSGSTAVCRQSCRQL